MLLAHSPFQSVPHKRMATAQAGQAKLGPCRMPADSPHPPQVHTPGPLSVHFSVCSPPHAHFRFPQFCLQDGQCSVHAPPVLPGSASASCQLA